eukprot:COSAG04_NODE_8606_length_952_cov_0.717468_1_plen_54_part_10
MIRDTILGHNKIHTLGQKLIAKCRKPRGSSSGRHLLRHLLRLWVGAPTDATIPS